MPTLSEALAQPDHRVRLGALKAALDGDDRTAPDVIVGVIAGEANAKVRNAMALVVGKLGTRAHAPALCRLLRDADAGVRLRAVEGIAALKDSASYPALVALLVAESDPKVRDFCAHHLMRLGGDNLMKLFSHMLVSDVGWVKESAVLALALFNSPRVVPLLRAVHQKEEGPLKELAFKGLERLAEMGNEPAKNAVAELAALREPPRLDVDFANLAEDTGDNSLGFEDTYTGGKLPRIEIGSPLEDDEDEDDGPPIAIPPPSAGVVQDTPLTLPQAPPPPEKGLASGKDKRPGAIKPPTSESRDKVPVGLVAAPAGGLFPTEPPPPEEPEPHKGSGRRPRPVPMGRSNPHVDLRAAAEGLEGGMSQARRGEDEMRPCPRCGAEVSAGARRCRHCSEVFTDAASPSEGVASPPVPFDVAFVAVLTMILGAVEAFNEFTTGYAQEPALGAVMGVLHVAEIGAAYGTFRGYAWGWYLWWPLAFFHFVVAASHGDRVNAGRAFLCLVSLSRISTREFCVR